MSWLWKYIWGSRGKKPTSQSKKDLPHFPSKESSDDFYGTSLPKSEAVLQDGVVGRGGVQGLGWYAARQRRDAEGDIADEFFVESTNHESGIYMQKVKKPSRVKLNVSGVDYGHVLFSSPGT